MCDTVWSHPDQRNQQNSLEWGDLTADGVHSTYRRVNVVSSLLIMENILQAKAIYVTYVMRWCSGNEGDVMDGMQVAKHKFKLV